MPHFNKWFLSWVSFQTPNHSNYIKHTLVTSLRLSHMHPPFITTQQTSSRSIKMTKILPFVHEGQGSKNLNWKKLFKQIDCYWTVWYMTELWEPERRAVWYPLGWSPFLRKTLSRGTADEGRGCQVSECVCTCTHGYVCSMTFQKKQQLPRTKRQEEISPNGEWGTAQLRTKAQGQG